ncbi:MAG TPA: hypothetical protein VMB74_15255 [Streptosporangiaceae bacterium]|nr:hypothetical protein [Streptosporangiaceae bacterium]
MVLTKDAMAGSRVATAWQVTSAAEERCAGFSQAPGGQGLAGRAASVSEADNLPDQRAAQLRAGSLSKLDCWPVLPPMA